MALSIGTRLGSYEIVSAIGAGGMSACGHASLRPEMPRGSISVSSRWGWGPSAGEETLTLSPCRS